MARGAYRYKTLTPDYKNANYPNLQNFEIALFISFNSKFFSGMKFFAKVVLSLLAFNYVNTSLRTPPRDRIGRRSNVDMNTFGRIPNNGGL